MKHLFPALVFFCLAACGAKDTDAGPGGVSIGEARALDEAAAMLEQQRLPPSIRAPGTPVPKQPTPSPSSAASPPA